MALRNPNLSIFGTFYPSNVYAITNRLIEEHGTYTNVTVNLRVYTDISKAFSPKDWSFTLTNLPLDPDLLNPALYQQKLLEQYGDTSVDGTLLSNFTVL